MTKRQRDTDVLRVENSRRRVQHDEASGISAGDYPCDECIDRIGCPKGYTCDKLEKWNS